MARPSLLHSGTEQGALGERVNVRVRRVGQPVELDVDQRLRPRGARR
jgi:hypothetical protein